MAMTLHFKFAEPLSALFGGHICSQHIKSHMHIVNFHEVRTN